VWLNQPLSDVLSTKSKVAILRVLSETPVPLNGREVARRAGLVPGHAHRVLADLVAAGLVLSRDQGRANTFEFADPESPITRRLRELFAAEIDRRRAVLAALTSAETGALSVVLFGSEARGDVRPGSDTDLLIVVERKTEPLEDRLSDLCTRLASEHQLALSWLVTDLDELREWQAEDNAFLRNVRAEGIRLAGQPLERLLH
jgi:predicted nucleotidyltransferase